MTKFLKNDIIHWLQSQKYWVQYIGNILLEHEELTEEKLNEAYKYFKIEHQLTEGNIEQEVISFNEIVNAPDGVIESLKLCGISEIEHVNALSQGQHIPVGESLTIIYGENGSGKSGYIRLLNNAFNSRGDKNIIPNIYKDEDSGEPSCKFTFKSSGEEYGKIFPQDKNSFEFSQFSCFDTYSVKIHLDNDNELNFVPEGFEFFEKIATIYKALDEKLNSEIKLKEGENPFIELFTNDNNFAEVIKNLNTNSDKDKISELCNSVSDEEILEIENKISSLRALDVTKKITGLNRVKQNISSLKERLSNGFKSLEKERVDEYNALVKSYHELKKLTQEEGVKSLDSYDIRNVGSTEWRNFIIAAKEYTNALQNYSNDDKCIFCLQPLQTKEKQLIDTYWTILKSESERELNRTINKIREFIKELKGIGIIKFDNSLISYNYIAENNPTLLKKWEKLIASFQSSKENLILNLNKLNFDLKVESFHDETFELGQIILDVEKEVQSLIENKKEKEITEYTAKLNYLKDKKKLKEVLPQVFNFIDLKIWIAKAQRSLTSFKTNSITSLQGRLFSKYITDKYKDTFDKECIGLKAPKVVEITQQNSRAKTFRKLKISGYNASQILSEGEQRAISLADFLTEIQMNPYNAGVIFDDPVTSLDHSRRLIIAERLVNLSKDKQVVIFTHDIAFLVKLTMFAEKEKVEYSTVNIKKVGDSSGLINSKLPWITMTVTKRMGYLKNNLIKLKSLEKNNDENYEMSLKSWYSTLRETWERSVEERLLKGAIYRFSGEIHTKPLSRIEINDELIEMINNGMTQASNWVHDQAMGLNPPIPDTEEAEKDLNTLIEFTNKCKAP